MPSSAVFNNPYLRSGLWLAAVALAAVAVSLVLAFASVQLHGAAPSAQRTTAGPSVAPPFEPPSSRPFPRADAAIPQDAGEKPATLWTLLESWALGADALAVLGMGVVLALYREAQHRGGARR